MNPVTGLSLGRIAVGVASIVKPDLVASGLGSTEGSPLITQAFGSREIALGLVTLLASGSARRNLVLVGIAVDAADAATAYLGTQNGSVPRSAGNAFAGVAVGATLSGLLGLRVKKQTTVEVTA